MNENDVHKNDYEIINKYLNFDFVYFCHGTLSIVPIIKIIEILNKANYTKTIFIAVNNQNIEKLIKVTFNNNNNISIIRLDYKKQNKLTNHINELRHLNKIYKKYFNRNNIAAIFGSPVFVQAEYYLLSRIKKNKKNQLFYIKASKYNYPVYNPTFLNKVYSLFYYFFYGNDLKYTNLFERKNVSIVLDKFFNNISIIYEHINFPNELTVPKKYKVFINYDILFFIDLTPYVNMINYNQWKQLMETIFEHIYIKGIGKQKIGLKNHPRFDKKQDFGEYGTIIPAYIPAEFLNLNNTKIIIAVSSSSLYPLYNENILKISLIKLVEWFNNSEFEQHYNNLNLYKQGTICFPQSIDELFNIIENKLKVS